VDLGRLEMPLNLLAGATDHITPPDQVFALADYASTPPEDVVRRVSSGGHLGLFMGHEALSEHWPPLLAAVLERSRPARRAPKTSA
jgi:poly(3-hydroxybutyrate) depolymerase